ncbi:MAG: hypothetical protein HZR80_20930 [Candidatus Heimdallarchaeota archaeon]
MTENKDEFYLEIILKSLANARQFHLDEVTTSEVDIGSEELLKTEDGVKSTIGDIMKNTSQNHPMILSASLVIGNTFVRKINNMLIKFCSSF